MGKTHSITRNTVIQHVNVEKKVQAQAQRAAETARDEAREFIDFGLKNNYGGVNDVETLRGYVEKYGTKKQRKDFETFERLVYGGKTQKEVQIAERNAKLLKGHLASIDNAQSLEELELIKKDFGNMGASEELQKAFNAKQDYFKVENFLKKQGLKRMQELMSRPATKSSGLTRAQLHKKLGIEMPVYGKSGFAVNEEMSKHAIELSNLKAENTKLQGSLADLNSELTNVKNRNSYLWGENLKLENGINELNQEIERINKNTQKISEFGHNSLKTIKKMKRAGIVGLIIGVGLTVGAYFLGKNNGKSGTEKNENPVLPVSNTDISPENNLPNEQTTVPSEVSSVAEQEPETANADLMADKYVVTKGDCPWNIAKYEIENNLNIREATQKKFEEEYHRTPTTDELISFRSREIRALNGIELEADGYTAIIHPSDTLDVKY